jgi:hypothetical protein
MNNVPKALGLNGTAGGVMKQSEPPIGRRPFIVLQSYRRLMAHVSAPDDAGTDFNVGPR